MLNVKSMGRIQKLPDHVANQIAAGEVVERPVAVVKELVENALDAGAKSIEVEFRRGGKSYIRVSDDGVGMGREDAIASLERHATSKIREAKDLLEIGSFGFRGEALPSIASVSKFRMRTRERGTGDGVEITLGPTGQPVAAACGIPEGTAVEVAQLFHTVPARRKFLKTERTEAAHIIQLCRLLAVAHPEVGFTLVEEGRTVFQSPPCASLADRVREIFGRRTERDLMSLKAEEPGGWKVSGLIGVPGQGRATRSEMAVYVNLRPVDSRLLNFALIESYHTYLPRGRYPVAFLFLEVPREMVDVNVHPAKREVRFRDEGAVRRFVMEALLARLREAARKPLVNALPVEPVGEAGVPKPKVVPSPSVPAAGTPKALSHWTPHRASAVPSPESSRPSAPVLPASPPDTIESRPLVPAPISGRRPTLNWRLVGLLHERFALWETPEGLVVMHVQAAWERVWFEEILRTLRASDAIRQGLLFPVLLELDPLSADVMERSTAFFESMGFEVELFGRNVFRCSAVPDWLSPEAGEAFLRDAIALMRERGWSTPQSDGVRNEIAKLAAQRAGRQMQRVERAAVGDLLPRLLACRDPLVDTRGRATFIEYRIGDLERRLGIHQRPGPEPE